MQRSAAFIDGRGKPDLKRILVGPKVGVPLPKGENKVNKEMRIEGKREQREKKGKQKDTWFQWVDQGCGREVF